MAKRKRSSGILKSILQTVFATCVLFLILELIFRIMGASAGTTRFFESIVYKNNLSKHKSAGEYRIFTFGESTMHGSQYGETSNPARWLEAYLQDYLPSRNIRVVNFSRLGQGSHEIFTTFRSSLPYKPDLAILYMGHNLFLPGNRVNQVRTERQKWSYRFKEMIRNSHFLSTIERWAVRERLKKKVTVFDDSIQQAVIEEPLGDRIGPENSVWLNSGYYWENIAFFKQNVLNILSLAKKKKLPTIFFNPISNLKDFAPGRSEHPKTLSAEKLNEWNRLYAEAQKAQSDGFEDKALELFQKAYQIDPTYADLCFNIGQLYFKRGDLVSARWFFEEARDQDLIKVRATRDVQKVFDELQATQKLDVLDTESFVVAEIPGGIPGEPIIEDNVHFSVRAHSLLGRALAHEIAKRNLIAPQAEWRFNRERDSNEIAAQLGIDSELYFIAYLRLADYFGRRIDNRIRFSKKALEIRPESPLALRRLAWNYWLKGDKENSMKIYQKLGEVSPKDLSEVTTTRSEIKQLLELKKA